MSIRFIARGILCAAMGCAIAVQAYGSNPGSELSPSTLSGNWVSQCFPFDDHEYQIRTFQFYPDGQLAILTRFFSDVECTHETDPVIRVSARWASGANVMTEEGLAALSVHIELPVKEQLTQVRQILNGSGDHFYLGVSAGPEKQPTRLDWAIRYQRSQL